MKTRIEITIVKRFALVLMMAVVLFAAMPLAGFESEAAPASTGKVYSIRATGIGSEAAKLHWGKASGSVAGYAIYRNGKYVTSVSNTTFSYQEKKLTHSTNYSYYVKAFRYSGKKVCQYYNTKTKKWQNTAPAKQYLGKKRWVNGRVYGQASPTLKFKTEKPTMIHGKAFTPSMCPKTFIKDSTKCKVCGKGKTIKVTYKNGVYNIVISGTDRSKNCNHK